MPNDNIDRAIKKGTGELESEVYEENAYEGYGPAGVAILVEAATDNRNRTIGEIRHLFTGTAAAWGGRLRSLDVHRRGYFAIPKTAMDEERFMDLALELGADDFAVEDEVYEIYTSMEDFITVQEELERRSVPMAAKELAMIPQTNVDVPDDKVNQVLRLVEALEDHDDVQKVWANLNISEKVLEAQSR